MIFLVALCVGTCIAALIRREAGVRDWARCGLGSAFVLAGLVHLVQPLPFEQHLPDWVPATPAVVFISGVAEIILGIALAGWRDRRQLVGWVVALYLVVVFPANVYVAVANVDVEGQPGPFIRGFGCHSRRCSSHGHCGPPVPTSS